MKPLHLLALPVGMLLAAALTGCVDETESMPSTLALMPAVHYPGIDCRSKYSLPTQKGCAPSGVLIGRVEPAGRAQR